MSDNNIFKRIIHEWAFIYKKHFFFAFFNLFIIIYAFFITFLLVDRQSNENKLQLSLESQSEKINELVKINRDLNNSGLVKTNENTTSIKALGSLVDELKKFKQEQEIRNSSTSPSISTDPATLKNYQGIVTVKNSTTTNIYGDQSTSSAVVATIEPEKVLFFYDKSVNWYQVEFGDGQYGWIEAQYITELPK